MVNASEVNGDMNSPDMMSPPRRLLVVAPAWVGDMVMSQVIYARLKATDPDVVIDVLAPEATVSLVSRMPEVNQGITIDQTHGQFDLAYRWKLGRQLARQYDQAILTPNSFKSALVPFFAGIPVRTGFPGECRYGLLNDIRRLDRQRMPRMVDRFHALAMTRQNAQVNEPPASSRSTWTPPKLQVDPLNQQSVMTRLKLASPLDTGRPVVGFCPGAEFGDAKKWPEQHYAALGQAVVASGAAVWLFGSGADEACAARISSGMGDHPPGRCVNLAGRTSLIDAVDLLAMCSHVVTNDSGLMHIAAAVGCQVIAIYGSTSPAFTPPLTLTEVSNEALGARIVQHELDCRPCFKRTCPLGHKNCLTGISSQEVARLLPARFPVKSIP